MKISVVRKKSEWGHWLLNAAKYIKWCMKPQITYCYNLGSLTFHKTIRDVLLKYEISRICFAELIILISILEIEFDVRNHRIQSELMYFWRDSYLIIMYFLYIFFCKIKIIHMNVYKCTVNTHLAIHFTILNCF